MLDGVARAVGASLGGAGSPLQALAELFGDDPWILILDNLEQVASAPGDLAELLGPLPWGGNPGHQAVRCWGWPPSESTGAEP